MVLLCALEAGFYLIFGLWVVIVVVWHADLNGFKRIFLRLAYGFIMCFGSWFSLLFIMFVIFSTGWDADDTDYVGSNGFFCGRNERALDCMFERMFY